MARGRGNLTPADKEAAKEISNNINHLLESTNTKQVELSRGTGIPPSTLTGYVKGTSLPIPGNVQKIADYFNVKKSDIDPRFSNDLTHNNISTPHPVSFITIPLYGDISCGNGMFVDDNLVDTIEVVSNGLAGSESDYFAQIASGDSMINAGINDGDLLIFKKSSAIENGQIGSFCIDDGIATCKKFRQGETFIQLIPMNPSYDPIVIDLNNTNFRVIGILKRAIKEF